MGMASHDEESACMAGTQAQFTNDGAVFGLAGFETGRLANAQNVEKSPSGAYGIPGQFATTFVPGQTPPWGIGVSLSGGKDFTVHETGAFSETDAYPRYAALPSDTTWYIACGTWSSSMSGRGRQLTDRIFLDEETNMYSIRNESYASAQGLTKSNNRYAGEILKTVDGGETFTSVHSTVGSIYFNGIDCASEDVCMVTAEGNNDQNDTGSIWGTKNGGETWELLMEDPEGGSGVGLFQVRMLSELEAWAVGGNLGIPFEARFFHTTDGGVTWEVEKVPQVYATELTMVNTEVGYATVRTGGPSAPLKQYL
jgi:hypothetical protein